MKLVRNSILFILLPLLLVLFHNCGQFSSTLQKNNLKSASCINNLQPVFEHTMYSFFQSNNCIECHSDNGSSGKYFAHSNTKTAFQIFLSFGSDRIKNKLSQSGGHSGNNYKTNPTLQQQLDDAKADWDDALENLVCESDDSKTEQKSIQFFETTEEFGKFKVLQSMLEPQKISWKIKSDLEIEIEVQVLQDEFNFPTYYYVGGIKAKSSKRYNLKTLKVFLNNKTYDVTTFEGINQKLDGVGVFESLYDGATAVYSKDEGELYQNSDKWSISIEVSQ